MVEQTDEITVTLSNKKSFLVKIVGLDQKTDLALIKIDSKEPLIPLAPGDSEKLNLGDWVLEPLETLFDWEIL